MAMLHHQRILPGKIAFGKTEVMNGVEQIGFAHAIAAANAYNGFGKTYLLVKVVFELKKRYGVQLKIQGCKDVGFGQSGKGRRAVGG